MPWLVCLLAVTAPDLPAPLEALRVIGWSTTAGNAAVSLTPTGGTATLGTTYQVDWTHDAGAWEVKVARLDAQSYWRCAIEAVLGADTAALTLRHHQLPVLLPLDQVRRGSWFYWTWGPGCPHAMAARGPAGVAGLTSETPFNHGCYLSRDGEGRFAVQYLISAWQPGDAVTARFRVVSGAAATQAVAPPPEPAPALDGPALPPGLVTVRPDGYGFQTPDGQPYPVLGWNLAHLPTLPAAEQVQQLRLLPPGGVTRILLPDYEYRPLPGVVNQPALDRLRATLDRCAALGRRAIVCLEYSGAGHQYAQSLHASPGWSDLYLLPASLEAYARWVEQVVTPLRDHPAILAWNVTNEPAIEPDPRSTFQREQFAAWLAQHHPDLAAAIPEAKEFEAQSTPLARAFFAWGYDGLAQGLIARAKLIRAADPGHLIALSGGAPRLLRGHPGAEVFDFWAPHTYDLWVNGPVIEHHTRFLVGSLRDALPDRPRPVLIEEFGISAGPKYPDPLRAEHIQQYLAAGRRWGLAGVMHWWDLTDPLRAVYAACPRDWPPPPATPSVQVWLPPEAEWRLAIYPQWPTRRRWEKTLAESTGDAIWQFVPTRPAAGEGMVLTD